MSLALTILAGALILILGLVGLWRDVQRGFLSLVGTLLGVVVVQLWATPFATWLEQNLGWAPSTVLWVASWLMFLFVVVFAGYGSGTLIRTKPLPAGAPKPRSKALARPAGLALGLLNGALISSILLQYTRAWSANETLPTAIADSPLLLLLIDWFAWFILGVALVIGVQAFIKWSIGAVVLAGRLATSRAQPSAQPSAQPKTQPKTQPAGTSSPSSPPSTSPANTSSAAPSVQVAQASLTPEQKRIEQENEAKHQEAMRRTAEKIQQHIGDPSSKP